jgi:hypothetical protein
MQMNARGAKARNNCVQLDRAIVRMRTGRATEITMMVRH